MLDKESYIYLTRFFQTKGVYYSLLSSIASILCDQETECFSFILAEVDDSNNQYKFSIGIITDEDESILSRKYRLRRKILKFSFQKIKKINYNTSIVINITSYSFSCGIENSKKFLGWVILTPGLRKATVAYNEEIIDSLTKLSYVLS